MRTSVLAPSFAQSYFSSSPFRYLDRFHFETAIPKIKNLIRLKNCSARGQIMAISWVIGNSFYHGTDVESKAFLGNLWIQPLKPATPTAKAIEATAPAKTGRTPK